MIHLGNKKIKFITKSRRFLESILLLKNYFLLKITEDTELLLNYYSK